MHISFCFLFDPYCVSTHFPSGMVVEVYIPSADPSVLQNSVHGLRLNIHILILSGCYFIKSRLRVLVILILTCMFLL